MSDSDILYSQVPPVNPDHNTPYTVFTYITSVNT